MMKNILFINACVRGKEVSRTYKIANDFINAFKESHNDVHITELMLTEMDLPCFTREMLEYRDACIAKSAYEDPIFKIAKQFADADKIIIAAPFWDLSFPSILKVYFEHICATNITFQYTDRGMGGLCKADKVLYITSRGGDFSKEVAAFMEQGISYITVLSKMLGIERVEVLSADGLDIDPSKTNQILEQAMENGRAMAKQF